MSIDSKTGSAPDAIEHLRGMEVLAGFSKVELVGYGDSALNRLIDRPGQTLLLNDELGSSYGIVTYDFPKGSTVEGQRNTLLSGRTDLLSNPYVGLVRESQHTGFKKDANHERTKPFWGTLGFNYAQEVIRIGRDETNVDIFVIPTAERVNSVLQRVFDRSPEEGYPRFRTSQRADGSSASLRREEVYELADLSAGYYPIASPESSENYSEFFKDLTQHLPGYALFSPSLNRLVKEAATEIASNDEHQAARAGVLLGFLNETSRMLGAFISNGDFVPRVISSSYRASTVRSRLASYEEGEPMRMYRLTTLLRVIGGEFSPEASDERKMSLLRKEKKVASEIIEELADNITDILNRSLELEQTQAA